jgi:myo-inositol-1(or 4)-monophosphatase
MNIRTASEDWLLELVKRGTRQAATAVRKIAWSQSYYDGPSRRYVGPDDHHTAAVLDPPAQQAILDVLGSLDSFVLVGEELSGHILCHGEDTGDLCFIADPLDGSAFARHRIPLASSSLCAYSRKQGRPIASAVTDVFLGVTYFTAENLEGAFSECEGRKLKITTSGSTRLENASCTALGAQPERFAALASQKQFTSGVRWLLNTGGALDICRVAAGDLDLTVEFAKGFRIWDVAAAGDILRRAGGVFATPTGGEITLSSNPEERYRFIAAATQTLFTRAQEVIAWRTP